jgi:hypothetical protein
MDQVASFHVLKSLMADYRAMRDMIFGEYPDFDNILSAIKLLEDEINSISDGPL